MLPHFSSLRVFYVKMKCWVPLSHNTDLNSNYKLHLKKVTLIYTHSVYAEMRNDDEQTLKMLRIRQMKYQ